VTLHARIVAPFKGYFPGTSGTTPVLAKNVNSICELELNVLGGVQA
jgi:hypothetical protein